MIKEAGLIQFNDGSQQEFHDEGEYQWQLTSQRSSDKWNDYVLTGREQFLHIQIQEGKNEYDL